MSNEVQELEAQPLNRVTVGVTRTVQVAQYQPMQFSAFITFHQGTSDAEIDELLALRDAVSAKVGQRVNDEAEAFIASLTGAGPAVVAAEVPVSQRKTVVPRAPRQSQAAEAEVTGTDDRGGKYVNLDVDGQEYRARLYNSAKSADGVALSVACDVDGCDQRASFYARTSPKTGVTYSAEDNLRQAVKYKGGARCYNHSKTAAAPARATSRPAVLPEGEDDDLPF